MKNKVIKASAGTGKTYTLSIEYLNLLINGAEAETIFVITFTRKATAEIRAKIFENIRKIVSGSEKESSSIIESIYKIAPENSIFSKDEIKDKIKKIQKELSLRKDKIKITTIDSFINTIFSKYTAPEMNIYSYEIVDEDTNREYIMKSFERIIERKESFEKITSFLKKYAERDVEKYIDWIKFMLENRWLFAMKENSETPDKDALFKICEVDYKNLISNFYSIPAIDDSIRNKGKESVFLKDFEKILTDNFEEIKKRDYKTIFSTKTFWKKAPIKKSEDAEYMLTLLFKKFKESFANYIYSVEGTSLFDNLQKIEGIIGDIYTEFKISDRKFTHSDIAYYTFLKIIDAEKSGKNISKPGNYFYEIFENSVKYLLIDEFQDTSIIQWKILKPIIEGSEKTICVGDEKQSIYSFRGGEKSLFGNLSFILNAEEKTLDTSYRSYEHIIEFVNDFFYKLNIDWHYEKVNYLPEKKGGCVKCLIYDSKSERNAYEDIKDIVLENGDFGKSAVLARTNDSLEEISSIFADSKIPAVKESSLSLLDHRAVKPFCFLISYISKNDFYDFLAFLRSDLILISEKTLQKIIECKEEIESFFSTGEESIIKSFDSEIIDIFKKIVLLKKQNYLNLSFLIFDLFNPFKKFDKLSDSKNCIKFITFMKGFSDINSLVKFIDENNNSEMLSQEGGAENNGITMMTIHKSKGLEFETVYFYIKIGKKNNNKELKNYIKYSDDFSKAEKLVFSDKLSDFAVEFFDNEIYNIEKKKEFDDWLNNLYVAFTRAKKNLYIFIELGKGAEAIDNEINSFDDNPFYYAVKKGFETVSGESFTEVYTSGYQRGSYEKDNFENKPEIIEIKSKVNDNSVYKIIQREFNYIEDENKFASKYEMQYSQKIGVASHYYLSFIKSGSMHEKKFALEMTMKKYGNMLSKEKVIKLSEKLSDFIESRKEYFNENSNSVNEFSIFDTIENREYRIDKIILNSEHKKCLIVDFKTGVTKELSQLEKYKQLVSRILTDYEIEAEFANIRV